MGFLDAPACSTALARGEDAQWRRAGTGGALSGQQRGAQLILDGKAESQNPTSAGSATHLQKGRFVFFFANASLSRQDVKRRMDPQRLTVTQRSSAAGFVPAQRLSS